MSVEGLTSDRCAVGRWVHVPWRVWTCGFNFLIKELSVENMKVEVWRFHIYLWFFTFSTSI